MDFFRNWLKMTLKKGSPSTKGRVQRNRRLILECLEERENPSNFGAGDLVVYRVGTGSAALSNASTAVFIDEYTPSGASFQSIALPTTGSASTNSGQITASGTAGSEGFLTLSGDSKYLLVTGYGVSAGYNWSTASGGSVVNDGSSTTSIGSSTSTVVNRVVGRLDGSGTLNASTVFKSAFSANNIRSAYSTDGNTIWATGAATGLMATTLGASSSSTTPVSTTVTNLRVVNAFNGQLYVSDSSGSAVRLGSVGSGLPTNSGNTITNLPGFATSGSPYGFFFAHLNGAGSALDTLYVADDGVGITKYSLNSGSWTSKGTVGTATDAYRGLTGVVSGGNITLYATSATSLVSISDTSGYNGSFSGTPTTLATAATNTAFRGVAFAPVSGSPTIAASTVPLAALSTTYGTASSTTNFIVSGSNLTGDLTVTPPSGFEVSTSIGSGYTTSLTLAASSGTVSRTTVYLRLASSTAVGSYSGNIQISGGGATTQNVATTASTVNKKALTITANNQTVAYGTSVGTVTGAGTYTPTGFVNNDTAAVIGGSADYSTTFTATTRSGSNVATITPITTNLTATNYSFTPANGNISVLTSAPTITGITPGNGQLSVAFTPPASTDTNNNDLTNYKYSLDGATFIPVGSTVSPFTITGLTNGQTYSVRILAVNSAGDGAASSAVNGTPAVPASPSVTVSGLSGTLSTTYGTASAEQSFTVSGSALTGNLTVMAPTGLEVSTTSGSGFGDSLQLTATAGTVANTSIYVRLKATAVVGTYNNVSISINGGGDDKTVSTSSSGNSVTAKALTITGISIANKEYDQGTSATITGTAAYSGLVNGETFSVTGTPSASFADKTAANGKNVTVSGYTEPSSNYSITQPTGLTANITPKALTLQNPSATSKTYDGTVAAVITGTLSGVISGDTVNFVGTGTFPSANAGSGISVTSTSTLTGTDANNYSLTQPTGLTADIFKANQTITFGALPNKMVTDAAFNLSATTTSGLTISYTSSNTSVATVSGNTITIVGIGTTTITASQAGDGNYNAASDVAQSFTVTRALVPGDILFTGMNSTNPDQFAFVALYDMPGGIPITFTDNAWTGSALATNEGTIVYTTPASGLPAGSRVVVQSNTTGSILSGLGTVGNPSSTFSLSTSGDNIFAYTGLSTSPTFLSGILTSVALTTGTTTTNLTYIPSGISGYTIQAVATGTIANSQYTDTTTGTVSSLTSGLTTRSSWTNSSSVLTLNSSNFTILQPQTITFNSLAAKTYGDGTFDLNATASSGLTVTYASSDTTVATISGSTVTILKAGLTTITASQAGDSTYAAATPVQQTLTINTKTLTVSGVQVNDKPYDATTTGTLNVSSATLNGVVGSDSVSPSASSAAATFGDANVGTGISVTASGLTLTGAQAGNYTLTQPTGLTGTITKVNQNITWSTPTAIALGTALSVTQLNASVSGVSGGSAPGSLTYNQLFGTVLPTGATNITVTAAATTNYNQTFKTVTLQVNAYYADPNPSTGNGFGTAIVTLTNGNVVITAPLDDAGGTDAGAVYLYSGATGALISTLVGSHTNDKIGSDGVVALSNGNFVIRSSFWDNGAATDAGAVTFGSAVTGVSGTLSSTNSLVGSSTNDHVGKYAITALKNGNYVVPSLDWDNGGVSDAGAVTFGDGVSGVSGAISTANSLVGSHNNDKIGSVGITELSNGNYVARSDQWDGAKGAVTWGNGLTGTSGTVDASNSIVGSSANDLVGGGSVGILGNGNLVFTSPHWHNSGATDSGAATWLNGTNGKTIGNAFGAVSASNSLVGSSARSGDAVGLGGVTVLKNNNYVVASANWNGVRGAATWGDGASSVVGEVSSSNSLVGDVAGANVASGGVTALANSNYLVNSMNWSTNKGAVTFGNGLTGKTGTISSSTSLVGTVDNSYVGYSGVTELSQGNFVVGSSKWNDGTNASVGAATFGSGTSGVTGVVSSSNSLVGSQANDMVGAKVTALKNGNFAVVSSTWANGSNTGAGSVTFGSGTSGVSGAVSASNSLVGSSTDDQLGSGGIKELSNGHFLVVSPLWNNNTTVDAGAVTWVNGTNGLAGSVSSSNSLVGTHTNDKVGGTSITVIPNGNYVVVSSNWDNGTTTDAGAVTWGNGSTGTSGNVGSGNSFVGTSANDQVGSGGVTVLSNNHFVVSSPNWNNGTISLAGAVTWGNGSTGGSGAVSSTNSLVGTTANDQIGSGGVTALTGNGNYVIASPLWDAGATTDVGAVTFVNGANGSTVGGLSSSNSLVGSTAGDKVGDGGVTALASGNYLVKSSLWNNGGSLAKAGAVTLGLGTTGVSGSISSSNSTVGSVADAGLQAVTLNAGNTGYLVRFLNDGASSRVSFGFQNPASPVYTCANNTTFTVGAAGSFTFTATGSPKPAFSMVSSNLPAGLTLNSVTGVLSGTPGAGSAGTYNLIIRATNGLATIRDLAFTLTIV